MKTARKAGKLFIVFTLLTVLLLSVNTTALAQNLHDSNTATIQVFWINKLYIGVKIIFPNTINGNFAGTLGFAHFDCSVVNSNTLYCLGPYTWGSFPTTLNIYQNTPPYDIVLSQVITPPVNPFSPQSHQTNNCDVPLGANLC